MSSSGNVDIRHWKPFWHVDPSLIPLVKFAIVFGHSAESLFITTDDEVFGIGTNVNGCLGLGDQEKRVEPSRVEALSGKKITSIAAGNNPHVLAITADGDLYVWGDNSYGQLGNGTTSILTTPLLCTGLERRKIRQVACGFAHSLVLTEEREVFGWGLNDNCQVGSTLSYAMPGMIYASGYMSSMELMPVHVQGLPEGRPVESIACSACSSFALTAGGELYGWGQNAYGELGIGACESKSTPKRVGSGGDLVFKSLACGNSHIIALTSEGQLFGWGHNSYGQVGNGSTANVPVPTRVDMSDCIFTEVGANHNSHVSAAVSLSGAVYAWGQLRDGMTLTPKVTSFSSIHDVFATLSTPTVTCKPMTPLDEDEEEASVRACLRLHLDNEEVSDITFRVGDQRLNAHASFLRMRSQYFRAMLNSNWGGQKQREVVVQGYSYNVYRAYLQYLYTDSLCVKAEDAMDLLQLADEYSEKDLKQKCENFVLTAVTLDNVFALYAASKKLSAKELEDFCFYFAVAHLNAATQTEAYKSLSSELAKDFFCYAGKRNVYRN